MTTLGIVLIAISAGLHAGWNLICKSKHPSGAFFLIATLTVTILLAPVLFWFAEILPHLPHGVWALLVGTGMTQAIYYIALGNAYRTTDVSIAYPLTRALPVIMIPIITTLLVIGRPLNTIALVGMAVVAIGCIILPMSSLSLKEFLRFGYLFILLAACGTAAYTIIDSESLRILNSSGLTGGKMHTAMLYIFLENLFILPFLIFYVMLNQKEQIVFHEIRRNSLHYPVISGIVCSIAYTMVLGAMQLASNVSYVMAFRQLSIPIGVTTGIIIFKEKAPAVKIIGVIMICAGLAFLAFK